jgi:hypothetical protein
VPKDTLDECRSKMAVEILWTNWYPELPDTSYGLRDLCSNSLRCRRIEKREGDKPGLVAHLPSDSKVRCSEFLS